MYHINMHTKPILKYSLYAYLCNNITPFYSEK